VRLAADLVLEIRRSRRTARRRPVLGRQPCARARPLSRRSTSASGGAAVTSSPGRWRRARPRRSRRAGRQPSAWSPAAARPRRRTRRAGRRARARVLGLVGERSSAWSPAASSAAAAIAARWSPGSRSSAWSALVAELEVLGLARRARPRAAITARWSSVWSTPASSAVAAIAARWSPSSWARWSDYSNEACRFFGVWRVELTTSIRDEIDPSTDGSENPGPPRYDARPDPAMPRDPEVSTPARPPCPPHAGQLSPVRPRR